MAAKAQCSTKKIFSDQRIEYNDKNNRSKSNFPEVVKPIKKFIISDEDTKNFPKDMTAFIARCKEIEKNLSASSDSQSFAETIFQFFRDSDMINEENIKLLTDEEFCKNHFDCEKSILKLDKDGQVKSKNYFKHMRVKCKKNDYYILQSCWYVQIGLKSSQEFYKWILSHAWKKFEQIKSKDIAEFIKNKSVVHSKYLSEFFSELVTEELKNSNLDKAAEFYTLAFELGNTEPLKILQLAQFYGEEKISCKILDYIWRNIYRIKTEDIFESVIDFVEKNKSTLQLKYLSEIFSKLAEKSMQNNLNRAIEFYRLAIKFDDKDSLKILQLAKAYEKSRRFNDAFRQYSRLKNTPQQEKAADRINVMGCKFNSAKNYQSAEICFEQAANMGNADAMNNFGCYLLEKRGTRQNEDEGFEWLYRAAYEFSNVDAKSNLEQYLKNI